MAFRPFANRRINGVFFALFLALSALALWRALVPPDGGTGLIPWDKAKHFIVFYGLAGCASLALPRSRLWRIGLVVLAFGGLIELVQPLAGRDADLGDLLADALGIAAAFGPMIVGRWRDR
jgi:VanZ family protein